MHPPAPAANSDAIVYKRQFPNGRVLLSAEQIGTRLRELGAEITAHYAGQQPCFLGLMNGALFFLTDLIRAVDLDMEVHCVRVNSYVGKTAGDTLFGLEGIDSIEKEIKGRLVLVVDDIFDTGHTLEATIERLRQLGAGDVKSVVCLEKTRERDAKIRPDWVGFVIEDEFVIGYGLDFDGKYRNLDHIRIFQD